MEIPPELEDQYRLIQYSFPAEFLKARTIGTSLVFSVGDKEVRACIYSARRAGHCLLKPSSSISSVFLHILLEPRVLLRKYSIIPQKIAVVGLRLSLRRSYRFKWGISNLAQARRITICSISGRL